MTIIPYPVTPNTIYNWDASTLARTMRGCGFKVNCVVTSPPYYGLRDYGADGQIGLEATPDEYVAALVGLFREIREVMTDDATLWLNLGDTYTGGGRGGNPPLSRYWKQGTNRGSLIAARTDVDGVPPKSLLGIPWRVAFALQADGWYLRSDIIWAKCLSGGAYIYARTQKGEMPMMVRDAARLDPSTVQLWNGEKWTQVVGWQRLSRKGTELELILRSGERISCTPEHRFPTQRGLVEAGSLSIGDELIVKPLPEPESPYAPPIITDDAAWFIGLYLAEGSRSNDTIQIAGHVKETTRLSRLREIASYYGGSVTYTADGNKMSIRVHGRFLNALIDQYISGRTATDKGLKVRCWSHNNDWLRSLLDGYLSGDGHWDGANQRWRLGFTRNYNLERDLRVLCARLQLKLTLKLAYSTMDGRRFPSFRGEIRLTSSTHHNAKSSTEIVEIRKARCREVYDVTVEDDPHLFALASGVLTHNSNPMPESVTDRPTKAHEYIFLLSKSPKYFYDSYAISEGVTKSGVVQRPNFADKSDGLFDNFWLQETSAESTSSAPSVFALSTSDAFKISVRLASSIFDLPQSQHDFSLMALNAKIRKNARNGGASSAVSDIPIMREATANATRFANGDATAKQFLSEMYRLWVALPDSDQFKESWGFAFVHSPLVDTNGNTTIGIDDSSHISQFDDSSLAHVSPHNSSEDLHEKYNTYSIYSQSNRRNKRTVWNINTAPFSGAHFATFPPKLIEPMILAGCPETVCAVCGKPHVRDVERTVERYNEHEGVAQRLRNAGASTGGWERVTLGVTNGVKRKTLGFAPTCTCNADTRPGVVFDPFMGAGTTALVARQHGRDYVGSEINPQYVAIAQERLRLPFEQHYVEKPTAALSDLPMFAGIGDVS